MALGRRNQTLATPNVDLPRDPKFVERAGPILDLYAGHWQGKPLAEDDFVLSTDEKTSIQARHRIHGTLAPASRRTMRVELEYERKGAWAYFAAWDVRQAKIFGQCERKTDVVPFERLVRRVMSPAPYNKARRVFWVMDNGSSHRGKASDKRLREKWPTLIPVHTPVHTSWLNQIEIYFSIVQAKVLSERFSKSDGAGAAHLRLRASVREDRQAVRVEVYPGRPRGSDDATRST